jgi:hypothetical protein
MGSGAPPTFRIPLILLAIANLVVLGMRLWPWQQVVMNLPLNGATGIDPAVCLLTYIFLLFWIAGIQQRPTQKALCTGALLGLLAGLLLAVKVALAAQPAAPDSSSLQHLPTALMLAAALLWGIAGALGARGEAPTLGMLAGLWSAMTSALIAVAAVLAEMYLSGPPVESPDPWKQYEGLALGNPAMQSLIHSLNSTTAYLLICPLVGGIVGLVFGTFGKAEKG